MNTCVATAGLAPQHAAAEPLPIEQHYTARQVADLWHLNIETVRWLLENEPGVVVLQAPASNKRPYKTIRIPQTVLDGVHNGLQVAGPEAHQ